jgi:hypothetical protein
LYTVFTLDPGEPFPLSFLPQERIQLNSHKTRHILDLLLILELEADLGVGEISEYPMRSEYDYRNHSALQSVQSQQYWKTLSPKTKTD